MGQQFLIGEPGDVVQFAGPVIQQDLAGRKMRFQGPGCFPIQQLGPCQHRLHSRIGPLQHLEQQLQLHRHQVQQGHRVPVQQGLPPGAPEAGGHHQGGTGMEQLGPHIQVPGKAHAPFAKAHRVPVHLEFPVLFRKEIPPAAIGPEHQLGKPGGTAAQDPHAQFPGRHRSFRAPGPKRPVIDPPDLPDPGQFIRRFRGQVRMAQYRHPACQFRAQKGFQLSRRSGPDDQNSLPGNPQLLQFFSIVTGLPGHFSIRKDLPVFHQAGLFRLDPGPLFQYRSIIHG